MDENLPMIRISVRNLVEFILREGNIDNRTGGGQDPENMQMGSRIHRKIQRQMGSDYQAEVPLKTEIVCDGFTLKIEGRADGLIHTKGAGRHSSGTGKMLCQHGSRTGRGG